MAWLLTEPSPRAIKEKQDDNAGVRYGNHVKLMTRKWKEATKIKSPNIKQCVVIQLDCFNICVTFRRPCEWEHLCWRKLPLLVGLTGAPHRLFLAADALLSEVLSMQLPLLPPPGLLLPLPGQLVGQDPRSTGHTGRKCRQSHEPEQLAQMKAWY